MKTIAAPNVISPIKQINQYENGIDQCKLNVKLSKKKKMIKAKPIDGM